jgi:RHS repeat-associated protein
MRRILSFLLLCAFVAQSSGSALAATASGAPHLGVDLASLLMPARLAFERSQLFAALNGTEKNYDILHAPHPVVRIETRLKAVQPILRSGRPEIVALAPAPPRIRLKDHRAMRSAFRMPGSEQGERRFGVAAGPQRFANVRGSEQTSRMGAKAVRATATPTPGPDAGAGIRRWWDYEETALPGVGKSMVNVGTGNLVIVADDVDVPEPGLDLTFHRVFNSQSQHDFNADDGSEKAVYGERWTNNFDAHIVYRPGVQNVITVYDMDGSRCDYTADGNGNWIPCAGEHAILEPGNSTQCLYYWIKPSGTYYVFHSASDTTINGNSCGTPSANVGHVSQIVARNHNNSLTYTYSWDGSGNQTAENITQILIKHSDGDRLTLNFGEVSHHNELTNIVRPDGKTLRYVYDADANLIEVDKPGNNTADVGNGVPSGDVPESYSLTASQMQICSPRATISGWRSSGSPTDGACILYKFNSANRVSARLDDALYNPQITDLTGTSPLQPPSSGAPVGFVTGNTTSFSGYNTGTTTMQDAVGHSRTSTFDAAFRVTSATESTGTKILTSAMTWDTDNNLTSTTDARGNTTNYAYDANGNTIAVALPADTTTSPAGIRPTSIYSYDPNTNNLLSYCDPLETHALGKDWAGDPGRSDSRCPSAAASGATVYVYNTAYAPVYEPYGQLTDTYTPMGYHRHITYDAAAQGGADLGLPTMVKGGSMPQADGSNRTPQQSFTYSAGGTLATYFNGKGTWKLTYDTMNRPLVVTDPDSVSSYKCYYEDGSVEYTESAAQHNDDNGAVCNENVRQNLPYAVAFTYDADGNDVTEAHHFMMGPGVPTPMPGASVPVAGITTKFYDGLDRLVEVQQPQDATADLYKFPWITRYFYDYVTGANPDTVNIGAVGGVSAYGNLFKTVECVPNASSASLGGAYNSCTFHDVRGNSFDALDRSTKKYEIAFFSGGQTVAQSTQTYDSTPSTLGLLSQSANAMNQTTTFAYDHAGRTMSKTYDDPSVTPNETYDFDLDGRAIAITSSLFGRESYTFDADGRLTNKIEPSVGYADHGTIGYAYYPDGERESVSLTVPALGITTATDELNDSYFVDGKLKSEIVHAGAGGTYAWTYTAAGRELTQTDPSTGSVVTVYPVSGIGATQTKTIQPKAQTYNAFGEVDSVAYPSGYASASITYDSEGQVVQDGLIGHKVYSSRGELTWESVPGAPGFIRGNTANGTICQTECSFQPLSGQMLTQASSNVGTPSTAYTYDLAGRNTNIRASCPDNSSNPNIPGMDYTETRKYDAENHTTYADILGPDEYAQTGAGVPSDSCDTAVYGQMQLNWGNSGHPYTTTISGVTDPTLLAYAPPGEVPNSYHWDGDQVLYTGNGTLYIGMLGSVSLRGSAAVTTFDRDYAGLQVESHTSTYYTAFAPQGSRLQVNGKKANVTIDPDSRGVNAPSPPVGVFAPRGDGYMIAGLAIQGVRAYDPTSSQWTTPDAYAGDVHDPMTQKPFMYNGNNPIDYSDPSGFCTDPAAGQPPNGCLGGVDWNLNMAYGNALDGILWTVVTSAIFAPARAALSIRDISEALVGTSRLRVLGGFSGAPSYIQTAYALGGRAWSVASKTWAGLTDVERVALNHAFLDQGIREGAVFELNPGAWGKWTVDEVKYLLSRGYEFEENSAAGGGRLVPKVKPYAQQGIPVFYDSSTI